MASEIKTSVLNVQQPKPENLKPINRQVANSTKSTQIKPKIAIIIDDLGHKYKAGVETINLKAPIAIAVIPFTQHGKKLAELAHKNNQEVMLHLPMQPGAAMHLMTDKTLSIHMMQHDLDQRIQESLNDIPHVIGVNNHMGSLFTQLPDQMQWLMNALQTKSDTDSRSKDLFFIDSFTSPFSIAYQVAHQNNIKTARRDVFLDRELNSAHMKAQIETIKRTAKAQGYAIAIGHPFPETLALLKKEIPLLEKQGFEFVKISRLLNTNIIQTALQKQIRNQNQNSYTRNTQPTEKQAKRKIAQADPASNP